MSELGSSGRRGAANPRPDAGEVGDDLEALRGLTGEERPDLETSLRAARRAAGETREGHTMAIRFLKERPALATVLAVVVAALALLAIPVSYERTVGYDVALTLEGGNVAQARVAEIARGLEETLGAGGVSVAASVENGRLTYVVKASAPGDVRASAGAFAKELKALGYAAAVTATPRRETVSSNVYAYAMNRVIEVSVDGKSASELESEIRQRLLASGVTRAEVSVTDLGGDRRQIKVEARHTADGATAEGELPELVLTREGKPLSGGDMVKVMKKRDASGGLSLTVAVTVDGKSMTAEIPNADAMGDAALAAEIQTRLVAAGIDAVVKVQGDQITVEKREP